MQNILPRIFVLGLAILAAALASVQTAAQQPTPPPKVHVIPQPRQMLVARDEFRLSSASSITLADPRSEDDRFAAQDFSEDVKETAGVSLKIGKSRKQTIIIGTVDQAVVQAALKRGGLDVGLAKSRATDEALRRYDATSTLPAPEEFGLGARPASVTR